MQLAAFTYDEAEKNAGNSYTPFAMSVTWLTWLERKARTKDRGVVGSIETKGAYMVHIGNRCVHSPVATLHTHLSDFMNVCIARRFFLSSMTYGFTHDNSWRVDIHCENV